MSALARASSFRSSGRSCPVGRHRPVARGGPSDYRQPGGDIEVPSAGVRNRCTIAAERDRRWRRGLVPRLAARARGALLVAAIVAAVVDGTAMAPGGHAVRGHGAPRDPVPGVPGRQRVEHARHRPPGRRRSATWLASMDASTTYLHPDYGPSGNVKKPYGIPWQIVARRSHSSRYGSSTRRRATRARTRCRRRRRSKEGPIATPSW